ncbi:MAG: ribonuclease III domain-containing protein [Clostridiales bacterium]
MKQYTEADLRQMSPLTLAYIGDGVYEMAVRRYLVDGGLSKTNELHKTAVQYVNSDRQSRLYGEIESCLSEEELTIFRHGRNAKSGHQPPNTGVATYRRATGLETLIGWLHLAGREDRLAQIFTILFESEA